MIFFAALLLLLLSSHGASAETPEELAKLPVKKLRQFLAARGLECKACTEKDDFVKLAVQNIDTPLKEQRSPPTPPSAVGDENPVKRDKKEIDDLMETMKKSGLGNFKFYSPEDLKKMKPEDMAKNMGGDTKYSKKFNKNQDNAKGGSARSGRKEKRQAQERFRTGGGDDDGERIEL